MILSKQISNLLKNITIYNNANKYINLWFSLPKKAVSETYNQNVET